MYIGNKPANIDKIKILGMYNITRGSDACGIVINNDIKKGVDNFKPNPSIKQANFSNFIEQVDIKTKEEDENYTIILHNRKASTSWSEKSNPDHAHPFLITDPDDEPILIGAHNGSIQNCEELKKKYDMKGTYPVDSQLMLSILAKCRKEKNPYELLKDYKGNAVLTWFYIDEPNTLYVWKGASKLYKHSDALEERPMYVWQKEVNEELYFSSMKEALYAIGGNETDVFNLGINQVHKFVAGKKTRIVEVKREIIENENFQTGSTQNRNSGSSTECNTRNISTSRYNTSNSNNNIPSVSSSVSLSLIQNTFTGYPSYKKLVKIAKKHGGVKENSLNHALIEYEPYTFNPAKYKSKVYFYKGRYFQNGHMIGVNTPREIKELTLDYMGYPPDSKVQHDKDSADKYYFYMGFLLADEQSADRLKEKLKRDPNSIILKEDGALTTFYIAILCEYCYGFCQNFNDLNGGARNWNDNLKTSEYTDGKYYPMFDYFKSYSFKLGGFIGAHYDDTVNATTICVDTLPNNGKIKSKETVIVLPERITPEKKIVTLDEVTKEEFINASLDFIKDGENIEKEYNDKIINTEFESLLNAIKQTTKHIKKRQSQIQLNDSDELFPVERGLLYS